MVADLQTLLQRLASIDLDPAAGTSRQRRNSLRAFRRLAAQLPAGAAAQAWDDDVLTTEQHDEAVRWRDRIGLPA